ncbi:tRNA pseudouridine32 synthase / 23S rRNA pseudouridine746 synthase [Bacteroides faecichinchillae]|uniref:tRNA pseudouridine32 synthase / 23S rRNA pseudouridine746 synthase n=1 Tax=Bacteroides faecichinchillae TaxID=871325 RepID=A0A1M4VMX7_9BACE|nr:RluA family pseudouridine synthase [Bacteroides faecichinchillae]THG66408.1 RNA pseudouridine synthase [Bacteroides faecichinchillae]SHE70213.1 tRNA pseudouridine32 synthase / 23S rRNA pseudouridine746 synthase [Bacteroides faecichinchillae]
MKHFFSQSISHIPLPEKFTYPFHYTPHPLCVLATEEVKAFIETQVKWQEELSLGKMFGVLIVQDNKEVISYLAAFSGNLAGKNLHPFFVPPVYDLLQPQGFFKIEEEQISTINSRIKELEADTTYLTLKQKLKTETEQATVALTKAKAELKANKEARELRRRSVASLSEEEQTALIKESQFQKANFKRLEREWKKLLEKRKAEVVAFETAIEDLKMERKERSAALQQKLFQQFRMLNAKGEVKDLCTIFKETVHKTPPGGAGECALPKLLQYAYLHQLKPLAMAEFWWGNSPKTEVRHHGYYYPSCKGKCEPILKHMLQGLEVDENPLTANIRPHMELEIVYEDEWLLVVNKPSGMLSVPGKIETVDSVFQRVREKYPNATGPMIVHRLDMATSGLLLIAKTKEVHQYLQAQFENHTIKKRYIALLDGSKLEKPIKKNGRIELPLCLNPLDRPRQMVSEEYGKTAITEYQVLESSGKYIRILFFPKTGRTHQLRIHAAHPQGLGCPIVGDELYGMKANRLYLHAEYIEFCHPVYGETICLQKEAEF